MQEFPSVAILIVTWNAEKLLRKFLPSVVNIDYPDFTVYLADNNSQDNSLTYVRENFPQVKIIEFPENYGFAKGNNEALKYISEDLILLLNNDVKVAPNFLTLLVSYLKNNPDVGIIQPAILSYRAPEKFEHAGAAGGLIDALGYPFCRGRILYRTEMDKGQYLPTKELFWAGGACMMFKKEVLEKNQYLFDEAFWAHMEELDFCWRAQRNGYKIACETHSKVWHLGGGSLPYSSQKKLYLNFRNNLMLLAKNLPWYQFYIILLRLILDGFSALPLALQMKSLVPIATIAKAHFSFYAKLPYIFKQRKKFFAPFINYYKLQGVKKKLILWEFFKKS